MFVRERSIAAIEAGACACLGCKGVLTDASLSARGWRHCKACRCAWKVNMINGTNYACHIEGPMHTRPRVPNRQLTEADYDGHEDLR